MQSIAGRLDILFVRLVERLTLQFEEQTGLRHIWKLIEPEVTRQVENATSKKRRKRAR